MVLVSICCFQNCSLQFESRIKWNYSFGYDRNCMWNRKNVLHVCFSDFTIMLEENKMQVCLKMWLAWRKSACRWFFSKSLPNLQKPLVALAHQLHMGKGRENASGWSPVSPTPNRRGQQIQITLTANQLQFTSLSYNKVLQYLGIFFVVILFLINLLESR